jgi:hypothetical protein
MQLGRQLEGFDYPVALGTLREMMKRTGKMTRQEP